MNPKARFSTLYYLVILAVILGMDFFILSGPAVQEIPYSEFLKRVTNNEVQSVAITPDQIYGVMKTPKTGEGPAKQAIPPKALSPPAKRTPWHFSPSEIIHRFEQSEEQAQKAAEAERARYFTVIPLADRNLIPLLESHGVEFAGKIESHWLSNFISNWILPFAALALIWGFVMRRMGSGALQIGRSKAKIYELDPDKLVRFKDVAGVDEAVEEVQEVVAFLKEPQRFTRLGANLPKGVLLVGPPGTGKTLLAKAVAGESGVPFFSLSGSDFVEMFVGVGAARVRDLFAAAKEKAPCIVFIDELDAIGKTRAGHGAFMGGYDERENTLNQLLVEMDGFDPRAGVVLMAATNRPEVLDPALLRPGRFDRQVLVGRPHREGRLAIFRVHTRKLVLSPDVDLARLAGETPGMVGADIANLCNEAALLASRKGHARVMAADFQEALERVIGGLEKKGRVLNERERRTVAYHESGHALVGHFTPGADPVQRISIVPRGMGALGYTLQAPTEDRYLLSHEELLGRVRTLLAGRAAEEIVFGEISTGAADDLEKASQLIRAMLTVYGMSKSLPNLSLLQRGSPGLGFLGQDMNLAPHSAAIEQAIGREQLEILRTCYEEAKALLHERRAQLETLARRLLEQEKLDERDIVEILGPRPEQAARLPTALASA